MKHVPLTVLVHEGPMARAYLGALRGAQLRPERVVVMVSRRDPGTRRLLAPWLPQRWRFALARKVQDLRMNHWSRALMTQQSLACAPWLEQLTAQYGLDPSVIGALTGPSRYDHFADELCEVFIDGLVDPALQACLQALPKPTTVLFTGGGIVPDKLLRITGLRLLHVHPGHLPHVRGADGLLWSMLLRGQPGATAFFLAPGIDTGDIVLATDLPVPPIPEAWATLDTSMVYRLLYAFVDPLLRAAMLLHVLAQVDNDPTRLTAQPQDQATGVTFHFMNERLRRLACTRLQAGAGAVHGPASTRSPE